MTRLRTPLAVRRKCSIVSPQRSDRLSEETLTGISSRSQVCIKARVIGVAALPGRPADRAKDLDQAELHVIEAAHSLAAYNEGGAHALRLHHLPHRPHAA